MATALNSQYYFYLFFLWLFSTISLLLNSRTKSWILLSQGFLVQNSNYPQINYKIIPIFTYTASTQKIRSLSFHFSTQALFLFRFFKGICCQLGLNPRPLLWSWCGITTRLSQLAQPNFRRTRTICKKLHIVDLKKKRLVL